MRSTFRHGMSSSPQAYPMARPWTPPESDLDETSSSPRSDYFNLTEPLPPLQSFALSDPSSSSDAYPDAWLDMAADSSPSTPVRAYGSEHAHPRPVVPSRPRPLHTESDPHTPTKLSSNDTARVLPQYPYTPDSARTTKRSTSYLLPRELSPLSPMPWDRTKTEESPVQNALVSCIANLEHLIHTSEPNDQQMEYIVSKFEELNSYLSAPEAQSKPSDEHLFNHEESTFNSNSMADSGIGMSISSLPRQRASMPQEKPSLRQEAALNAYIQEVGTYISSVKKNLDGLKKRHEETSTLNSILLDVIADLRKENIALIEDKPAAGEGEEAPRKRVEKVLKTERWMFFGAMKDALDEFGEMFFGEQ